MPLITDFIDCDAIPVEHREAVEACIAHNIMGGRDDGTFGPNNTVTLGEICKCAWIILTHVRHCGNPGTDDVPESIGKLEENHWAAPYINYCRKHGVYTLDGNTISPDRLATYGELYEVLSCISYHITQKRCHSNQPEDLKSQITRSGLAQELCLFCQFIGKWYLHGREQYYIPDPEDLITVSNFVTFLPENYSDVAYIFNFAFKTGTWCKSIPFEPAYKLLACKRKHLSQCKAEEEVYHFTKLETLKIFTQPDARFRLHNAEFLNDPSEGQVLLAQLSEYIRENEKISPNLRLQLKGISSTDVYKPFRPNNTYIASFQLPSGSTVGSLPMWYTYADAGRGCAIKFSVGSFDCNLYRVHYSESEAKAFLQEFIDILDMYWNEYGPKGFDKFNFFWSFAFDILMQSTYLFKDHNFSYENEVRAIMFCPPQKAHKADEPREGELLPRTFCETPFEITHVIFGPAVPDPKRLAVGLAGMGLDCTFEKSDIPFTIV